MADDFIYAYPKCQRKAWHLGDVFSTWEEVGFERGNYVEHYVFRKPVAGATADDRQLARDYPGPHQHDPE